MVFGLLMAAALTHGASSAAMNASHGRYYGKPDLTLTAQMIAAGGGAKSFSSEKLVAYLAGPDMAKESASLQHRFGAANVAQFFKTFDAFVHLAVIQVERQHISLPDASVPPAPTLARSLYNAGVMPDGRYDVGYMLEHMLSRPMHITLMHEADADTAVGPRNNAEFHVILSAAIMDLHRAYPTQ